MKSWCFAGGVYIGMLLGPERTRECFFLGRNMQDLDGGHTAFLLGSGWCCCESGLCVLFENCTVDASIFFVSSLERTVDALAPGADEGRRRLR